MWNICGWIWRLSASALVSEWPKTTAASHSLLLLCYSLWNVLLCSYPRTSSISSFAFKMHHTTVTNIFTHNVRTNLFTTFLERRLKQDSLLFLSGWAGREDKLGFTVPLWATEKMRRDIFYFRNRLWVCMLPSMRPGPWHHGAAPQQGALAALPAGDGIQRTWWGSFSSTQTPRTWQVWAEQSDDLNWCFYNKNLNREQKCVEGGGRGVLLKRCCNLKESKWLQCFVHCYLQHH